MAHEDLYEQIEKRRAELHEDLSRMRSERDAYVANVNQKIKMAQDALDALPVPRVRRTKKQAEQFVGDRDITAIAESRGAG